MKNHPATLLRMASHTKDLHRCFRPHNSTLSRVGMPGTQNEGCARRRRPVHQNQAIFRNVA